MSSIDNVVTETDLDIMIAQRKAADNKYAMTSHASKKPIWVKTAPWTFAKAKFQVQSMGGEVADNAEELWDRQSAVVLTQRKLQCIKGSVSVGISLNCILSGNTSVLKASAERRNIGHGKQSATKIEQDICSGHWLEATAVRNLFQHMG